MKIGIFDGSLAFASGTIVRGQDRTAFLTTALGRMGKEELVNPEGDWRHVALTPEPGIGATLIFQGERLRRVLFAMAMPSDDNKDWSVEKELDRKSKHDAWLRVELGKPPYEYAWGRVGSEFDPRGLASEIIVTYAG